MAAPIWSATACLLSWQTRRGNQYVLVLVEQFSKTVVLMPTRDKEPATVAEAFTR
jgi:hypothetical protein